MEQKSLKQKYSELDNRLTYIVGFRNLFNIAVMMVGFWFIYSAQTEILTDSTIVLVGGFLMLVLGMKWFLVQTRENIDATEVYDELKAEEIKTPLEQQ